MSHSSIREYIVRLRRLDDMLRASDFPDEKFCGSEQQWDLIENMTDANQNNYRIALRKYDQYLSWQKTAVC
ncbi:MAG: Integrase-SAM-like-N domain-containing protein [Hafnia paralvei]